MSDIDLEDSHQTGCSNSEYEHPGFSSVDSTKIQGVNVCSPSVNHTHDRASFKCWDHLSTGSPPYKGNPAITYRRKKQNPVKGRNFQSPQPIQPLEASFHQSFRVTVAGPWVEGKGEAKGGEKLYTIMTLK